MKKILKISLVLGIVLLAMNVYAVAVNFSLHNKFRQEKMISFGLEDKDQVKISIYDANDKLIQSQLAFEKNLITFMPHNLRGLEEMIVYKDAAYQWGRS